MANDIEDTVKSIIVEKLGVDESDVTPDASITNDLGADSLDTVELIMEFEKEFDLTIPDEGRMYSINEADDEDFSPELQSFLRWLKRKDPATGARIRARYIGSFVSDFHRNLLTGGIYIYPSSASHPEGKLRLMYEANPMAFLVEQAGGRATDGHQRILDINPTDLHQRTPLFIGSPSLVDRVGGFLEGRGSE